MNTVPAPFDYTGLSDAALVQRFHARDEAAFSQIYDRYASLVHGVALRVARTPERAEEIVQDTLLKLWRNPRGFDPARGALSTYLVTLARNAAIDALRRDRNEQLQTGLEDDEGEPLPLPSADAGPLERAEFEAVAVRVRAAMGGLSAAHRQTVELAYFGALSREEIAQAMDVPVGTVKSRLKYALDKLKSSLSAFAGDL
jgi:RNA polymerase sigma-70 factor (ECF subfamily)